jgi:murein DD-endopeptidase MepM/ murein hydrolase activator NlpD
VAVQDTLADSPPGEPDREHPANHVTVRCGDVEVFMAHLMRGSAKVSAGAMVRAGEPVGRVGNSGHTLEPHLHIGAKRSGVEVGLVFDGRWLSMNSVVRASASGGRPGWR